MRQGEVKSFDRCWSALAALLRLGLRCDTKAAAALQLLSVFFPLYISMSLSPVSVVLGCMESLCGAKGQVLASESVMALLNRCRKARAGVPYMLSQPRGTWGSPFNRGWSVRRKFCISFMCYFCPASAVARGRGLANERAGFFDASPEGKCQLSHLLCVGYWSHRWSWGGLRGGFPSDVAPAAPECTWLNLGKENWERELKPPGVDADPIT